MAQYDKSIALATRLIAKFGAPAVLRRFTDAALADPDKPWRRSKPSDNDIPVSAVFLNFGDMGRAGEQYMSGTDIQTGDKLVIIPGEGLSEAPRLRDRLYRDGAGPDDEGWAIVQVQTLDPNGQQVLHQLQVRH